MALNWKKMLITGVLSILTLLVLPIGSKAADHLIAGNFYVDVRAFNEETVESTPIGQIPTPRTASLTVPYDAQDHGFKVNCASNSIYSTKYVIGSVDSCTVVNDAGQEIPHRIELENNNHIIILEKPDVGVYTITIKGNWSSGSISGQASLKTTLTVTKGSLYELLDVVPYSGTYDGKNHNAITASVAGGNDDFVIEYKKPGDSEYSSTIPEVKDVSDSGTYYCKVTALNNNFTTSTCTKDANVKISKKQVTITTTSYTRCVGEEDPNFEYTLSGLAVDDQISGLEIKREKGEGAGNYEISAVWNEQDNPNYYYVVNKGTLTIRNHSWKNPTYTWSSDNATVTAKHICYYDEKHVEEETVEVHSQVMIEPTCTLKGQTKYTANAFKNSSFVVQTKILADIKALGHEWDQAIYEWSPDYSWVKGTRYCKHDNSHKESETVYEITSTITSAATCTKKGARTHTSGSFSKPGFEAQSINEEIQPLGHSWNEPSYSWNENNTKVTATRTCSRNSQHTETETVNVSKSVQKNPTCTDKGTTKYTSNTFSNTAFLAQSKLLNDINPIGHEWSEPTYVWNQDNTQVTATLICNHDSSHIETETVDVTSVVIKQPTCTSKGKTAFTGNKFINPAFSIQKKTVENIEPLGHDWEDATYTWLNNDTSVKGTRICKHDQSHVETEIVSVSKTTVPATCQEPGYDLYTSASFKNKAFKIQERSNQTSASLGHDWSEPTYEWGIDKKAVTATCICKHDSTHNVTEIATVLSKISKAATLEEMGVTTYYAHFENDLFSDQEINEIDIPKLSYNWSNPSYTWSADYKTITAVRISQTDSSYKEKETVNTTSEIIKNPTCTEKGQTKYTSDVFNNTAFTKQTKTVSNIPAKGHTVCIDDATSPTCTESGKTKGSHCAVCGYVITEQSIIPPTGHHYIVVPAVSPTHYTTGISAGKYCEICGIIEEEQIKLSKLSGKYVLVCDSTYVIIPDDFEDRTETYDGRVYRTDKSDQFIAIATQEEFYDLDIILAIMKNRKFYNPKTYNIRGIRMAVGVEEYDSGFRAMDCFFNTSAHGCHITIGFTYSDDKLHIAIDLLNSLERHTEQVKNIEATCLTDGLQDATVCSDCGAVLQQGKIIQSSGHTWGQPYYVWSSDSKTVTAHRDCLIDDDHSEIERVNTYSSIISPTNELSGGDYAFSYSFLNSAFSSQKKLKKYIPALNSLSVLNIPRGITTIESEAFSNIACEAIIIPSGCKSIDSLAFANCKKLLYIQIPSSVTKIANDAFAGIENLVLDFVN